MMSLMIEEMNKRFPYSFFNYLSIFPFLGHYLA